MATIARLYAIDTSRGVLRWSVANPCLSMARQCAPRVLSNGSVAYESISEHRDKPGSSTFDYKIRMIGADGKENWSRQADSGTEFVVPPGTSILVVRNFHGLEILDERGTSRWVRAGAWVSLNVTQRPGLFFACGLPQRYYYLSGFEADGREVLHKDWTELGSTDCGPVHSGPGNLLFYEGMESVHGQNGLWSFLFPGGTT